METTQRKPPADKPRTQGERIRYARKMAGLSQSQVAAGVRTITGSKITKSLVSQWERDVINNPNNANMLALQAITGFSLEWLVRGRGPEKVVMPSARAAATSQIDQNRLARAMRAANPDQPADSARAIAALYDLIGDTPDISDELLARIAATLTARV